MRNICSVLATVTGYTVWSAPFIVRIQQNQIFCDEAQTANLICLFITFLLTRLFTKIHVYKGSYKSVHVLLSFVNELGKSDKI